MANFTLGWGRR